MRLFLHVWFLVILTGCQRIPEKAAASLTREAYVWQQVASPAQDEAIHVALPALDSLSFHAADIRFDEAGVRVQKFPISWPTLVQDGRPVSLVVRIYTKTLDGLGEQTKPLEGLIRSLMFAAKKVGLNCREVQLDYDCPDSKLTSYADFLHRLRVAIPEISLPITVLPSWLDKADFRPLAETAGEYVLQVHSLHTPLPDAQSITIFEPKAARRALDLASQLGIPFRLALPTYRSTIIMDGQGKRGPAYSENLPPSLEDGQRYVSGAAEPMELAPFVSQLLREPPPYLTGLIWYRLPVSTDRMNWPWSTFQLVSHGLTPESELTPILDLRPEGFSTIQIRNTGEQPERMPERVLVSYPEPMPADGLAGYTLERSTNVLTFSTPPHKPPLILQPGTQLTIGWIRIPPGKTPTLSLE